MFVFHEDCAGVDVDDADGVPAAGGHARSRLLRELRIGLEHHFPDLALKKGKTFILKIALKTNHT